MNVSPPVQYSSHHKTKSLYAQGEANLYLTVLIFRDVLRGLYKVKSASLSRFLVKNTGG